MEDVAILTSDSIEQTAQQFLGRWNRLVSTTNWEKGRIILEWRTALEQAGAPASEYSDEAWSQRVGSVSPQHVGRLRRVFDRFGESRESYPGLFWSHFQAALDWDDAEMWLEGAMQNDWSISQMRTQRASARGLPAENVAAADDAAEELDADAGAADLDTMARQLDDRLDEAYHPDDEADEDSTDDEVGAYDEGADADAEAAPWEETAEPIRPFAELPAVPDDVEQAFETCKLAILRHKMSGWQEVTRDAVIAHLDALRQMTLASAEA